MGSPRLPEEIIEDIIVKLPAKSIVRFQAVRKSWFDLIKSSRFIRKHQIETEESFLALCFIAPRGRVQWDSLELSTRFHCDRIKRANFYKLYILPGLNVELSPSCELYLEGDRNWHVVCDYNGILCLTNYKNIMLVNPSWKELKAVPNPTPNPQGYWFCRFVGFGFDNMTMDFKVVRGLRSTTRYCESVLEVRVEVYSLRSNSWRELIGFPFPVVVGYVVECCTFFNGVIYWCFHKGQILTFNLSNNVFNQLKFPQGLVRSRESFRLFVLNKESLAILSYTRSSNSPHFVNVWILNEHGTEATWTKLYSIGPLTHFEKPLSFWTKDKLIYKETNGKLILYDLLNHNTSVVFDVSQIRLSDACLKNCLEFGVYRPSLVSINM